jgi:anti-anti-sigma factor
MNSVAAPNGGLHVSARTEARVTIAELAGELDIASAPGLREQLLALLRPGSGRLVIDLSRVSFCDASGLAVLIGTGRRAGLLGGFLRLAAVPPEVSRVLRSTGLDRHLHVFPTVVLAASASNTPSSRTGWATQAARRARSGSALPVKLAGPAQLRGDSTELRNAVTAVLNHVRAWHDADPDRLFTPTLQAMARACAGTDAVTLDTAARSLLSVLSRHPSRIPPRGPKPLPGSGGSSARTSDRRSAEPSARPSFLASRTWSAFSGMVHRLLAAAGRRSRATTVQMQVRWVVRALSVRLAVSCHCRHGRIADRLGHSHDR